MCWEEREESRVEQRDNVRVSGGGLGSEGNIGLKMGCGRIVTISRKWCVGGRDVHGEEGDTMRWAE